MGGIATLRIIRANRDNKGSITYNPEDYAAAGGEIMVFTLFVSWILTLMFHPEFVESNMLKDRVGYNNLCVGWDIDPARAMAAPMFALIIFFQIRHWQLDHWRSQLDPTITDNHRLALKVSVIFSLLSWLGAIGIFSNHSQ